MAVVLVCPPRAQGCQSRSSLALLQHNVASGSPGASRCSARLCLGPTFLLRHTAQALHLIYTLVGERLNAENPARKKPIRSLFLNTSTAGDSIFSRTCSFDLCIICLPECIKQKMEPDICVMRKPPFCV